eukprot:TRINITY_DN32240_c0_g2_i1.p2 TRINITY_DN32240_c0_g2~~TRINITY_DN32240_c0_g2_i1.p2  ORF type:complete len:120 (+),score=44.07 TRINITY_DN32240_c0_g2_i1:89-448(+)
MQSGMPPAMEQQMEHFANAFEGESFFSTLRSKCWEVCFHDNFDPVAAAERPLPRKADRLDDASRACLKRCIGRMFKIQEEVNEQFVKSVEELKEREQMQQMQMMGAMQGGPPPGMPQPR